MKKITMSLVKGAFEKEGYTLLQDYYERYNKKIKFRCPKGHEYAISWDKWQQGVRCKYCTKNTTNIKKVKQAFEKEGYTLCSTKYKNASTRLEGKCPKGHSFVTQWRYWQQGKRCRLCRLQEKSKKMTLSQQQVVSDFAKEGYRLLEQYDDNIKKMKCLCSKGHICYFSRASFIKGKRCEICRAEKLSNAHKTKHEERRRELADEGYVLLTQRYVGVHDFMEYRCPNGHEYHVSYVNWSRGVRCPFCNNMISKGEEELFEYYSEFNPISRDRKIIFPKELDIYFPKQKVAIEYCGLYWHSTIQDRINSSYHYKKMEACNNKGIRLITIFEDEWQNNKELCISRINAALKTKQTRIYARKCTLRELSKIDAESFLNNNHLQGYVGCSFRIGLYYKDELVSVMTFGKPARAHISKKKRVLELKRFASLPNHIIIGGASKLLSRGRDYAKKQGYEEVVSYCDMRWGTGSVYNKMGFSLKNFTKYTPHYTDFKRRYRNQTLAKTKEKTEKERVKERKLYKIYDCGHQTWSLPIDNVLREVS